jgi:transposase InsO family protein
VAWGEKDVSEQRLKFVIRAETGKEQMSALCREFEISRPTGYAWLARYRLCERVAELKERSRRPHRSPQQTAETVAGRVVQLRQQYPDWGAKKLRVLLSREGIELPRITLHRILLRRGLVREQDRHRPAVQRFERKAPNELWQVDFKGMPETRAACLPLTILDDHSRYLVGLFELAGTKAEPVQRSLQTVFERDGVPEAMLMDHGTPWWNMHSEWGWTWLTVWLMRQGIRLHLSGYRHPQTQGKVERSHGSLEAAMLKRPKAEQQGWQPWLDAFRQEYNQVRPHEALGMEVPAQRWRSSPRRYQSNPPAWDYSDPANVRTVQQNGGIQAGGRNYFVSRALIGESVQMQWLEDRIVVYFCHTLVREFDLRSGSSHGIDFGQMDRARTQALLGGQK